MARIFVTRKIPNSGIALLRESGHDVTISSKDGVLTQDELHAALKEKGYDALLPTLSDTISEELLAAFPNIKIVANYAVGFDNIDLAAAKTHGVVVTNTPGVLTEAVAEHTMALIFAIAKRVVEADRFTRAGKYTGWGPMLLMGTALKGKTLGVIGAGRIGSKLCRMAHAMGISLVYFDIKRSTVFEEETNASYMASVEDVLKNADIVSLHVPLLPSTRHLINTERLAVMKQSAYLINTSRGPVVDERALVAALQNNTIRGAALDVFEDEPQLAPGLADLENVVLTPHIATATEEARQAMSMLAAKSIIDVFLGKTPDNIVEA